MEPQVSVVMPAYNAAKTVEAAAGSILGQTYADLELIVVDDGSTDGTWRAVTALAARDARVRPVRLAQNGGASAARNAGLDLCRGTYLFFMDADDTLAPDAFARALSLPAADVTVFGVVDAYLDASGRTYREAAHCPRDARLEGETTVRRELIELEAQTLLGYTPNKLYRLSVVRESGARFEDRLLTEDIFFNLDQCSLWRTMNLLSYPALRYCHRTDGGSVTSRFVPDFFDQQRARVARLLALYDGWGMTDARVLGVLGAAYARYLLSGLERALDARAHMDAAARRDFLRAALAGGPGRRVLPLAAPQGLAARAVCRVLQGGSPAACYALARAARFARTRLPALFTRLRQSR